jgi:hypothetical protein
MSQIGVFKYSYLAYFSHPPQDRPLYRSIREHPPVRILEVGMGDLVRAERMIAMARRCRPEVEIHYTGVDLFEDRPQGQRHVSLKSAYRLLRQHGARVRLIPGNADDALSACANTICDVDLLVIALGSDDPALHSGWIWLPRMLHTGSQIYVLAPRGAGEPSRFDRLTLHEVLQRAKPQRSRLRYAAA